MHKFNIKSQIYQNLGTHTQTVHGDFHSWGKCKQIQRHSHKA